MRETITPPFSQDELDLQRDVICAYIDRERDIWLDARKHAERAAGMDAEANRKRDNSMKHINHMLEELIEIPGVKYV